jgi:uncharacterized SAM-binding protein YcdF (DUF218 family)
VFFPASKVIYFLITPSNLFIFTVLAGLLLSATTRLRRTGTGLATLGALGLALGGLAPLSEALLLPLEQRFAPFPADAPAPAGIIVLGGAVEAGLSEARDQVVVNDAGERPI